MKNEPTYPTIISYFTKDWKYEMYSKQMIQSCKQLNLDYHIVHRKSQNGYLKNCRMKPYFILESLKELKRPVLWIDVDGDILKPPEFFKGLDVDFAAKKMREGRKRTWHVGTMWFNYNEKVLEFIDKWIYYTENSCSDEEGLDRFWNVHSESIKTVDIPPEYFFIKRREHKPIPKNTVIFHRISNGEDKRRTKKNRPDIFKRR